MKQILRGALAKRINLVDNEQGMTLLEVLMAFVILSVVLVTLLNSFALAGRENNDTCRYNEALTLAQSKLEEVRNQNYDSVISVPSTQFQGMSYALAVADKGRNNKTVTVSVFYSDKGIAKQLDLTTEVARK